MTTDICTRLYEYARSDPGRDVWMELGGERVLVVQSPDTAGQVLTTHAPSFEHAKDAISQVCGASRVTENGDDWKYLYDLSQPQLNGIKAEELASIACKHAMSAVTRLVPGSRPAAREANRRVLFELTSSIMNEAAFNRCTEDFGPGFLDDVEAFATYVGHNIARTSLGKPGDKHDRNWLDGLGDLRLRWLDRMADIRPTITPHDRLLYRLSTLDPAKTTRGSFECELLMLFGAGSDTAAATISWAMLVLAEHPVMQRQLREHLAQHWDGDTLDTSGAVKHSMLGRFLNEVFRLYPAIPFLERRATRSISVNGHRVTPGDQIVVSSIGLGRNPDVFARPDTVDLHRGPAVRRRSPTGIFPFGAGARRCGGQHIALIELPVILAILLRHLKFDLQPATDIGFDWKVTMHCKDGVPVTISRL